VLADCRERLDDDTLIDLLDRPVSELIAEFCRSLGLTPDWEALAAEARAMKEIEAGDVGAPLAAIAERMIAPPLARRPVPRGPAPLSRPRPAPSTAVRAASP